MWENKLKKHYIMILISKQQIQEHSGFSLKKDFKKMNKMWFWTISLLL